MFSRDVKRLFFRCQTLKFPRPNLNLTSNGRCVTFKLWSFPAQSSSLLSSQSRNLRKTSKITDMERRKSTEDYYTPERWGIGCQRKQGCSVGCSLSLCLLSPTIPHRCHPFKANFEIPQIQIQNFLLYFFSFLVFCCMIYVLQYYSVSRGILPLHSCSFLFPHFRWIKI